MVDSEPAIMVGEGSLSQELVACTICEREIWRETMGTRCVMDEPKSERTLVD